MWRNRRELSKAEMTNLAMGIKITSPKFVGCRKKRAKKEEMVMLCNQHGVEIKAGLNIASEGPIHHWGKGLNVGQVKAKVLEGKMPSFW